MSANLLDKNNSDTTRESTLPHSSTWLQRKAKAAVLSRFGKITHGQLSIHDGQDGYFFGTPDDICSVAVTLHVLDPEFYVEVALGGSLGGAEAFMQNYWACDDLTGLIRLLIRNRSVLDSLETGLARLKAPLRRLAHWMNRNHMANSRKNIQAHYDLGNEFFGLFLDPTMMYSAAIFPDAQTSLEAASTYKMDLICQKLELTGDDHLIEIGTGWGGLACYAAQTYGCRVTTTTISDEQFVLATQRVSDAGLQNLVTVLRKDYRLLDGQYDKLVSVEMIEAVGHEHLGTFFEKCSELMKPDGMMLLQAITIADRQYERSRRTVDFIQKYIFPGGALPSLSAISYCLGRFTDLSVAHTEDIGPHYAETLRRWHSQFNDNLAEIRKLGFPEEFVRMWRYYFCYCEAGFEERVIHDLQILMHKPLCRSGAIPG